jgi:hypothetical protein
VENGLNTVREINTRYMFKVISLTTSVSILGLLYNNLLM